MYLNLNTTNNCAVHVFDWLNSNSLRVNLSKSKVLFCPSASSDVPDNLLVGDVNINASPTCNYLGVTVDEALCSLDHISRVCRCSLVFISLLPDFFGAFVVS